ncbi:DUF6442 family protein, partial [Helcococcus ovis]
FMDKEDILNKFKIENSLGDVRENYVSVKSYSYGIIFSTVTFLLIFIISLVKNLDYTTASLMFVSIIIGNSTYKYFKERKNMKFLQKIFYICFIIGGSILYISYLIKIVG